MVWTSCASFARITDDADADADADVDADVDADTDAATVTDDPPFPPFLAPVSDLPPPLVVSKDACTNNNLHCVGSIK